MVAPVTGWKSSEFWLHLLAGVGGMVYMTMSHSPDIRVVLVTQAIAAVYGLGRTWLKTQHLTASDVGLVFDALQQAVKAVETHTEVVAPATPVSPASPSPESK